MHVKDNLIVSTPTGMDLSPGFNTHPLNEETLDVGVDILLGCIQPKLPFLMKRS
jgi:hypothetical protein